MNWEDLNPVAFDFETSGSEPAYALQPWRWADLPRPGTSWITSVSLICYDGNRLNARGSQLFPLVTDIRKLLERAIAEGSYIVGWNITFDIAWLFAMGLGDLALKAKWLDAMLLWKHLEIEPEYEHQGARHKKKSYALKPGGMERFIPVAAGYEEDIDFHATDAESLAKLQKYNDRDSVHTWIIGKIVWDELTDRQRKCALIEAECLPMVAQANYEGMLVDTLACKELGAHLDAIAADLLEKLAPHGVTEKVVRSPMQLSKLMFDDWKLPVLKENVSKKTGKTTRSTDKEVLHELAFQDERAKQVRQYREALNNKAKFSDTILDSVEYHGDGRTRPSAIVFGTYSGRLTYGSKQGKGVNEIPTGFALHQEKRDKVYRNVIIAPPGFTLMEFDASGQEYRWMAIASGDSTMQALCMPGEDPHSFMGSRIAHRDYRETVKQVEEGDLMAKNARQLGKVGNLCIAEGTTILTDRGPCNIEHVRADDLVWDGEQFVAHEGVSFSGVRDVITYQGVTGTPDHKVLTEGGWVELQKAAQMGWAIEPALGAGRTGKGRAALRVMGGIVRRAVHTLQRTVRDGALRLRHREGGERAVHGDRAVHLVPGLRHNSEAPPERQVDRRHARQEAAAETGQRNAAAMLQPQGSLVSQLRRAWDRVSVRLGQGWRGLYLGALSAALVRRAGYRPHQQRWSLRAWKLALGHTQGEPGEPRAVRTYDIVNCGPNTRFAANGVIVHNSLQYRTSAKKLRSVARVQYEIPLELPEAQRIHKTYQETYPGVVAYWATQIALTKQHGFVETFAGRRVQVVGDWGGEWGWSMGSTAINYRIQGTGADQKYLAMMVLRPYLTSIGGRFAWDLHDGIYLYVPTDKAQQAAIDIKNLLDNLPYAQAWGFTPPIPLPWDCKAGPSWGELKEWKFN